ncbi:hypothetical protein VQ042_25685 [Aurantimonas sp. A2-1-M11]|uniref:hypothetical protein n=1 Tax=Aurantimonas sp. A2-1-M11 TaxID=3113712 RepID=UPI002F9439B1
MPRGEIRWNITGANPKEGEVYTGPIELEGSEKVTIYTHASDADLSVLKDFQIAASAEDVQIDPTRKAKYTKAMVKTGVADAFAFLKAAEDNKANLSSVLIDVGAETNHVRTRFGSDTILAPQFIRDFIAIARRGVGDDAAMVQITVKGIDFETGYDLEQFFKVLGEDVQTSEVDQS